MGKQRLPGRSNLKEINFIGLSYSLKIRRIPSLIIKATNDSWEQKDRSLLVIKPEKNGGGGSSITIIEVTRELKL